MALGIYCGYTVFLLTVKLTVQNKHDNYLECQCKHAYTLIIINVHLPSHIKRCMVEAILMYVNPIIILNNMWLWCTHWEILSDFLKITHFFKKLFNLLQAIQHSLWPSIKFLTSLLYAFLPSMFWGYIKSCMGGICMVEEWHFEVYSAWFSTYNLLDHVVSSHLI